MSRPPRSNQVPPRSPPTKAAAACDGASPTPRSREVSRVLVGRFGAAHGLRGEIRLQSFTQDPLAIADYGPLTDAAGKGSYVIETPRPAGKGMFVARVKGVTDRTSAERLVNVDLYADRARLPPEDEDEFYVSDLIGLVATTPDGARVGVIVDVANYGAGDLLEIRPEAGRETLLIPFTRAAVPEIDRSNGRVTVIPPVLVEDPDAPR